MAGSTAGLGYGSLSDIKAPRGTRRGGGGGGQASGRAGAKLNPDEEIGIKAAKPGEAPTLAHPDGPTEDEQNDMATQDTERQMGMPTPWRGGGRNAQAAYGSGEGRPDGSVPGGMSDTDDPITLTGGI